MSGWRILFLDRDGTLNEEPPDEQVDSLAKVVFLPGVIPALLDLKRAGFAFVLVTNQDGLGTAKFPQAAFEEAHAFILKTLASQGIEFEAVFVCPHFKHENCPCRKPAPGMVEEFLRSHPLDAANCRMIGDRDTDLEFAANLGIEGLRVRARGSAEESWPAIARRILESTRRASVRRTTKETDVCVEIDLSHAGSIRVSSGIGFLDHMLEQIAKHAGIGMALSCRGDLHIDEHHTVEDCALALGTALRQALGDKRGIARYGFLLAMDEAEAEVALDLSGRPYFLWEGHLQRDRIGDLPTELVPHFFRSLAETMGAALHLRLRGENTHHMIESCFKGVGRALRQAIRIEGAELPSTKDAL